MRDSSRNENTPPAALTDLPAQALQAPASPCPVCGGRLKERPVIAAARSLLAGDCGRVLPAVPFWQCARCDYLFREDPRPSEQLTEYYDQATYVAPSNEQRCGRTKDRMFRAIVRRLRSRFNVAPRRPLAVDFGCSYGHLGLTFKDAGWSVIGVDIAPSVREHHRRQGNFPTYASLDCPEIPDRQVDAICMIDVLYYLREPLELLRVAYRKLAPGGVLFLRVPHRAQYLKWSVSLPWLFPSGFAVSAAYDHIGFCTPRTIRVAAKELGFQRCDILWREKGYAYPTLAQTVFHGATQFLAWASRGAIPLATVFQAEMWKGAAS
jgi:SAM-dependent methyltransferase